MVPLPLAGCYLIEQGIGQLGVQASSIPLERLKREIFTEVERDRLALVAELKKFAEERFFFRRTRNYTTYFDPGDKPISYSVLACRKDRLQPVLWHFPVAGSVPYKAHFRLESARAEARGLERKGYDVVLAPVSAYSTLGYLRDPILAGMLRLSRSELVDLIAHELFHSTVYAPGQAEFNESLASFAARIVGERFIAEKWGEKSAEMKEFRERAMRAEKEARRLEGLAGALDALYRASLPRSEMEQRRARIFELAQREWQAAGCRPPAKMQNAWVVARRTYLRYDYWQSVYIRTGRKWEVFLALVQKAASQPDPMEAVECEVGLKK